jgi:hypothetical protein
LTSTTRNVRLLCYLALCIDLETYIEYTPLNMLLFGPGQFALSPGERVTVTILKSVAPFSSALTDLFGGPVWSPKPDNAGTLIATGGFDAPPAGGATISFGGLFNFVPAADDGGPPDIYVVTLAGSNGGSFDVPVFGPGAPTRTFTFFS